MLQVGALFCWGADSCCVRSQGALGEAHDAGTDWWPPGHGEPEGAAEPPVSSVRCRRTAWAHHGLCLGNRLKSTYFPPLSYTVWTLTGDRAVARPSLSEPVILAGDTAIPSSYSAMPSSAGSGDPALVPNQRLQSAFTVGIRLSLCLCQYLV